MTKFNLEITGEFEMVINGVNYVPVAAVPTMTVDCDGTSLKAGERAYVRQSRLAEFNRNMENRNGTVYSLYFDIDELEDVIVLDFDDDTTNTFPVSAIRRDTDQNDYSDIIDFDDESICAYCGEASHDDEEIDVDNETGVDCDGNGIEIGDRVYVRQSALANYSTNGMTHATRNGTVSEIQHGVVAVRFDTAHTGFWDNGFSYFILNSEVRLNADQN